MAVVTLVALAHVAYTRSLKQAFADRAAVLAEWLSGLDRRAHDLHFSLRYVFAVIFTQAISDYRVDQSAAGEACV